MTRFSLILLTALLMGTGTAAVPAQAQESLPAKFANDPVAKALGPEIFNKALKEGQVNWYGADVTDSFLQAGGKERFEKRFGIKIIPTIGRLREQADRIRTEQSVGKPIADMFDGNDQYMLELHGLGFLQQWRPPAPELDRINKKAFVRDPAGFWWPVYLSAQALLVNTNMVKEADIPKSYKDLLDPKWKGKVAARDPRSSSGGGWQFLHFYVEPTLGIDYIKKVKEIIDPFILTGGSEQARDAIATGRFALGFGGRGENIRDLPKGTPVKYVVPKEGLAWTPASMTLLKGAKNENAAKVVMTWFYEVPQLKLWSEASRPVPHPDATPPIPEMSVSDYPLMDPIPAQLLAKPNAFFKEMEQTFGVR